MSDKDRVLLNGMLNFAYKVKRRMTDLTLDTFLTNDDLQDAVLYALGQMGEKANNLSDKFIEDNPREEWYGLIGLRNRIFHTYEDINLDVVFHTAKERLDSLIELLGELVERK